MVEGKRGEGEVEGGGAGDCQAMMTRFGGGGKGEALAGAEERLCSRSSVDVAAGAGEDWCCSRCFPSPRPVTSLPLPCLLLRLETHAASLAATRTCPASSLPLVDVSLAFTPPSHLPVFPPSTQDLVYHSGVALVIAATKYDAMAELEPEQKKVIGRTLR